MWGRVGPNRLRRGARNVISVSAHSEKLWMYCLIAAISLFPAAAANSSRIATCLSCWRGLVVCGRRAPDVVSSAVAEGLESIEAFSRNMALGTKTVAHKTHVTAYDTHCKKRGAGIKPVLISIHQSSVQTFPQITRK